MNARTWGATRTGLTFHSFTPDGRAICRGNIRRPEGLNALTEAQIDSRLAEAWGARARGFRKCGTCTELEAAAQARLEASLAPSAGEGDYLPPAEVRAAEKDTAPDNKENSEMPVTKPRRRIEGPLSDRQEYILGELLAGKRQKIIGATLNNAASYVSTELAICVAKFKAKTTVQACGFLATARAYREAADMLEGGKIPNPIGEEDEHVNDVLDGMAGILRERADRLTPQ